MWTATGTTSKGNRLKRNQASPQWEKGKFTNPLPEKTFWKKMLRRYWNRSKHATTTSPIPIEQIDSQNFKNPPASGLRITWFGHSSILIEIDGTVILVNPVWGSTAGPASFLGPKRFHKNPITLDELPRPDAIIFSHDHYDHLDYPTINKLKEWNTKFVMPLGLGAHLEYWGVKPEKIIEKDWWEELHVKDIVLACVPARHFSGRGILDRHKPLWSGWALVGKKIVCITAEIPPCLTNLKK